MLHENELYNCYLKDNNLTYSVDMLRLKTYITYSEFSNIEFFVNSSLKENIKRFWVSDKIMQFHYNYVIEFDTFSFWFGFMHNNESINYNREDVAYNFTIEFNPNKLKDNNFIIFILNKFSNWYIKSFDVAVDIPVNIRDIVFDLGTRRKLITHSYGGDNITYSIGAGNGRVKIYNKKRESDLPIVGYLTRVELSVELDDFPVSNIKRYKADEVIFPELFLNQYIFSFSDYTTKNKTTLAILYAVQSGYPLKDLSRVYRDKIKKMLEGGYAIKLNRKNVINILQQTIYFYFVRRESRQVIF